jgi:exodeoxyribonuclease III
MKVATWNVNSLRIRLPHLLDWLRKTQPDVIALQETKVEDHNFPTAEIAEAGYSAAFSGQKSYNGVAILARSAPLDVQCGIPALQDEHRRVLAANVGDTRFVCAYVPNGQAVGTEKYAYKLRWLRAFSDWLRAELAAHPQLIVLGDCNIAPEDRDVHDPQRWRGQIMCSEPEREGFRSLIELGLADTFRLFDQPDQQFTWWDYRLNAFKRNLGLRIDHILASPSVAARVSGCAIDLGPRRLERPSDHAPVIAEIADR